MPVCSSRLDELTTSLFSQLRQAKHGLDFDVLQCPMCPERLEAMELDLFKENGEVYQRIWWTCRGLKNKNCQYPMWLPSEVFWTKRSEEEMKSGFIPLPNINLLPKEFHYLYPTIFGTKKSCNQGGRETKDSEEKSKEDVERSVTPSSVERTTPSTSGDDTRDAIVGSPYCPPVDSSRESTLVTPLPSQHNSSNSLQFDDDEEGEGGSHEQIVATTANGTDDDFKVSDPLADKTASQDECFIPIEKEGEDQTQFSLIELQPVRFHNGPDMHTDAIESQCESQEVPCAETNGTAGNDTKDAEEGSNASNEIEQGSEGGRRSCRRCGKSGSVTRTSNKRATTRQSVEINEKQMKEKRNVQTKNSKKNSHALPSRRSALKRECGTNKNTIKSEQCDQVLDSVEFDKYVKGENLAGEDENSDVGWPWIFLRNNSTPFHPFMLPGDIFDAKNWVRPVRLGGRTSLDAFVTGYNMRYNRREFLEALGCEMNKRGIMKFVPYIPIKQQRRIWCQKKGSPSGMKPLDIERIKQKFDFSTLRLQIGHRLGISDALRPTKRQRLESDRVASDRKAEEYAKCHPSLKIRYLGSSEGISTLVVPPVNKTVADSSDVAYNDKDSEAAPSSDHSTLETHSMESLSVTNCKPSVLSSAIDDSAENQCYIAPFENAEVDALVQRKLRHLLSDEASQRSKAVYMKKQLEADAYMRVSNEHHIISPLMYERPGKIVSDGIGVVEDVENAFEEYLAGEESFYESQLDHSQL